MNPFTFLHAIIKIGYEVNKQKKFNQAFLLSYVKTLEEKYHGVFPPEQLKKIFGYYALFIPSFLCSSFKRLYGKKLTDDERKRVSLFGILTPVGDDLFDIDNLDVESIRTITFTPDAFDPGTFSSKVATDIQSYLISQVPNKREYLDASKDVFEIQLQTIRQTNPAISTEEIKEITWAKGGYSVIIYHQVLNEKASPEMLKALFNIGALMQLTNDCFDIYKDIRDGIFTLASRCEDYQVIRALYLEKVKEANLSVRQLPFSESRKSEFLVIMHAIISRGLVAIDQMIRLQQKTGSPVNCLHQDRKDLITDMQKLKNVVRWFYYAYKLPQL